MKTLVFVYRAEKLSKTQVLPLTGYLTKYSFWAKHIGITSGLVRNSESRVYFRSSGKKIVPKIFSLLFTLKFERCLLTQHLFCLKNIYNSFFVWQI